MTFQPLVPLGGYSGWLFLNRTLEQQQDAFNLSPANQRLTDNFRERIAEVETAEQLVDDRELLTVALGAFGLSDDINNKFFIRTILEEGTVDNDALANRLADNRYAEFSRTFGFGDFSIPLSQTSVVADQIIEQFNQESFQVAVGEQNNALRLALNFESDIVAIADAETSLDAQWFNVLGNAPLREVVQTALGLPSQIAAIDIDTQLETFKDRAQSVFGTDQVSDFTDPDIQDTITRLFLPRSSSALDFGISSQSIALTLLR